MTVSEPGCWKFRAHVVAAVMLGLGTAGFVLPSAPAGPPFRTDDPVPVDYAHGELYFFATGSEAKWTNEGVAPALETNYGFAPNAMIHAIQPLAYNREDGATN